MAPLLALGLTMLPALTRIIAGDKAGGVADTVTSTIREVTGTNDPAAARAALEANPAAAEQLRARLAEIAVEAERVRAEAQDRERQAALETLRAQLQDVQSARQTMVSMGGGARLLATGPGAISVVVTVGFFGLLAMFMFWNPGKDTVDQQAWALLNIAVGALVAGFSAVINFWIGSSNGSRSKDALVEQLTAGALRSTGDAARQVAQQADGARAAVQDAVQATLAQAREMIGPPAPPPAPVQAPAAAPAAARAATSGDARFLACLAIVLRHEGGFVNDPQDPGGATNLGITKATLESWRGAPVTEQEVRDLTQEEAREIYRARYWNRLRCDDLPAGIDLVVFDMGVNAGPGTSAKLLQRAVSVAVDGAIGPITIAAARAAEPAATIDRLSRLREEYYRGLAGFARFGKGWLRRTDDVRRAAQSMAAAG